MKGLKQRIADHKLVRSVLDFAAFLRECFRKKKILVISDSKITSISISSRIQTATAVGVFGMMLWVSFSTGKYFAYETVLSEKDREIWTTNLDNENLQYQVSDLHKNLSELDKYFESIRKYDQLVRASGNDVLVAAEELSSHDHDLEEGEEILAVEGISPASRNAQVLLTNIRKKVLERIEGLELIIEMTGLKLEEVAANNGSLKRILSETKADEETNQGGPFLEFGGVDGDKALGFNKAKFENKIEYLIELEKVIHTLPLSMPMDRYYLSSHFGKRVDPIRKRMAMHNGIDLVGSYNSRIVTTAPGVVTYARPYGAYGKLVEIDHGAGVTTRYGHLSKVLVKKGQTIKRGQIIGLQGNSGRSTGPHLHYEVRYNNKPINPKKFLQAGQYVF